MNNIYILYIIYIYIYIYIYESGLFDSSVGKESACNAGDPDDSWVRKIHWRRDMLPTPVFLDFFSHSAAKESACNAGDLGPTPGLGRSPGERKGCPHH